MLFFFFAFLQGIMAICLLFFPADSYFMSNPPYTLSGKGHLLPQPFPGAQPQAKGFPAINAAGGRGPSPGIFDGSLQHPGQGHRPGPGKPLRLLLPGRNQFPKGRPSAIPGLS